MPTLEAGCNDGCAGILHHLAAHVHKKVRAHGVLVDFGAKSINAYYHLEPVNVEPYDRLYANPNYPEILRMLTNGQGERKLNNEGQQTLGIYP